ncbi:MAG: cytochrome c3 family protein [Thermodesulfobacteriota bacterium]|nr:cytochrome c3 family protein [Thermodesulfobacteriota bacterium]
MQRVFSFCCIVCVMVAFIIVGNVYGGAKDVIEFEGGKIGKVTLSHKKHNEDYKIECATCHHMDKPGAEQGCTGCHPKKMTEGKMTMKKASHQQCTGCHKKQNKGPKKCKECHIKK